MHRCDVRHIAGDGNPLRGRLGGFSQADEDALARSPETIGTAPVGATRNAKLRGRKCVTDAEFDRAVMVTITAATAMWPSGALEKVEVI